MIQALGRMREVRDDLPPNRKMAPRAALVAVSEDALHLKYRRIQRDVALVFAGADARVYPQVKKNRHESASTSPERTRLCLDACECTNS